MGKRVRIGVVGSGYHLPHYMAVARRLVEREMAEVAAACDRDGSKGTLLQSQYAIRRFTTEPRDVIEAADVDLVLILEPNEKRAPLAAAALRTGKHVLAESPMAASLAESAELVLLAREGPGRLLCAPHAVLSPTYRAIWKRVRGGSIGKVLAARALSGALFDFGVESLTGLIGPARRVAALAGSGTSGRADNGQVLIDFGDGVLAAVTAGSALGRRRSPAFEIYGGTGTIQMLGDQRAPRGYELWENAAGSWKHYEGTALDWTPEDGLRHLVECIHAGTRPAISPEHADHTLEILHRARESAADGAARAITSTFEPLALDGVAGE